MAKLMIGDCKYIKFWERLLVFSELFKLIKDSSVPGGSEFNIPDDTGSKKYIRTYQLFIDEYPIDSVVHFVYDERIDQATIEGSYSDMKSMKDVFEKAFQGVSIHEKKQKEQQEQNKQGAKTI